LGYIDKVDVAPNTRLYVRADLHGDLKSLLDNLSVLQQQGFLDLEFKCQKNVHLVFLGDYSDRGFYGTQILELLIRLREENRGKVHLIRGNHEESLINVQYGVTDTRLRLCLGSSERTKVLNAFYATMSLSTYFSCTEDGVLSKQYVQFTHGLFEPTMDVAPLLNNSRCPQGAYMGVPKERTLSSRITQLADDPISPYYTSARRIQEIVRHWKQALWSAQYEQYGCTVYNWGDVSSGQSLFGSPDERKYRLCAEDIFHYFQASSGSQHKVMFMIRGHEHEFQHLFHEGTPIVTTLPVGAEIERYAKGPDRAYMLTLQPQVKDWMKSTLIREIRNYSTSVTRPVPIYCNEEVLTH
jgi:hypothetical protein